MIVGQERKSIDNCLNHIVGAANLLVSRERDSFPKTSSPEMFYCLRNAIVMVSFNLYKIIKELIKAPRSFAAFVANYPYLQ